MAGVLAACLLYVVASGTVQLLAALPVAAAAESLPDDDPEAACRFWRAASLFAPLVGIVVTALAITLQQTAMIPPHLERVRPHICARWMLDRPDSEWHFQLAGALAFALIAFAVVRFAWRWISSARAEEVVDGRFEDGQEPVLVARSEEYFSFTMGLQRGFVVISRGLVNALSDEERQALLAHELAHVRRRDNIWHLVVELGATLSALIPLGFLYAYRWRAAAEADCDLRAADASSPEVVAEMLVMIEEEAGAARPELPEGLNPVYHGGVSAARRAARLTTPHQPQIAPPLLVVLWAEAIIVIAALLLAHSWVLDSLYCAGETVLKGMGG